MDYGNRKHTDFTMIQLAQFNSEIHAQMLESRLSASGVDCKLVHEAKADVAPYKIMVFEDDLELAQDVLEGSQFEDDLSDEFADERYDPNEFADEDDDDY